MADFKLADGQTILFIGDSITDCGRRDVARPLGDGYVKLFSEIVAARMPQLSLDIINRGIGGNKVDDLRDRWEDDVMREEFDWLSVKIGINDIHRHLTEGGDWSIAEFANDYDAILSEGAGKTSNIILIDPFYLSNDTTGSFRTDVLKLLGEYLGIIRELASKYDALHLRAQAMFQKILESRVPDEFCPEPVHPYRSGHLAIALELYKLLGGEL